MRNYTVSYEIGYEIVDTDVDQGELAIVTDIDWRPVAEKGLTRDEASLCRSQANNQTYKGAFYSLSSALTCSLVILRNRSMIRETAGCDNPRNSAISDWSYLSSIR